MSSLYEESCNLMLEIMIFLYWQWLGSFYMEVTIFFNPSSSGRRPLSEGKGTTTAVDVLEERSIETIMQVSLCLSFIHYSTNFWVFNQNYALFLLFDVVYSHCGASNRRMHGLCVFQCLGLFVRVYLVIQPSKCF